MRHLRSILYALVLAPAVWTLAAVGFTEDLTGRARTEGTVEALTGLLLLLLAGAAYAILLLPRLSPAGPVLAALVFLAAAVWVLIDPASFDGWWPAGVRKEGFDLTLPADGLAVVLAVPLLCTALIARRWRGHDRPATRSVRTAFGGPPTGPYAGFDEIGLPPGGDATQVLAVGRPEEATQVIPASRPGGARMPAFSRPGSRTGVPDPVGPARDPITPARDPITPDDTGVTEPIAAARDADVAEPVLATAGDTSDSASRRAGSVDDADPSVRQDPSPQRSEPHPEGRTTDSTPDAASSAAAADKPKTGAGTEPPHAAVDTKEPPAVEGTTTDPGERTVEQPANPTPAPASLAAATPAAASSAAASSAAATPSSTTPSAAGRAVEPDGRTVDLDVEPGDDRTQVIPVGLGRFGSRDDERTQVLGVRGVELEGKTQVISAYGPDAVTHALDGDDRATRTPSTDGAGPEARATAPAGAGERTTGTVTPPTENTQVLGIPVAAIPGERTTVRRTPTDRRTGTGPARDGDQTVDLIGTDDRPTVDIAARDDRTTAAIPAPRTPHDDEPTTVLSATSSRRDDEPTTDLRADQDEDRESTRPMTVGGLERPADEVEADTARRTGQTTQRRPAAVPTQPSPARTSGGAADDSEATRQL